MGVFVDSNVLVYACDASEPVKQARASAWLERLWRTRTGHLSTQVLHEAYVTMTRKLRPGMPPADARDVLRDLLAWRPLALDGPLLEAAWGVQDRYGISFWDALVVAAANRCGCDHLLTEDLPDGQVYWEVTVVDPFRHEPTGLPS